MKNFNRRSSHGPHGSKRRELAQHSPSHEARAFTHTLHQHSYNHVVRSARSAITFQWMLGLFVCVSVIHRTLTWTTWSWTYVRDLSYACVYTRGLGWANQQRVSTTFFVSEKLTICIVLLTGFEPSSFGPGVRRSTNWATPPALSHLKIGYEAWSSIGVKGHNSRLTWSSCHFLAGVAYWCPSACPREHIPFWRRRTNHSVSCQSPENEYA